MPHSPARRNFLATGLALPFLSIRPSHAATTSWEQEISRLEQNQGVRLGICTLPAGEKQPLAYRGEERFPMCSTFKVLLVGAILNREARERGLLSRRIFYSAQALVSYSPITEANQASGMTVDNLCAAALQYSDNTAANLLLKEIGGPAGLTAYARSLGDTTFRLDRWEPELNSALPGDARDTTTPLAMTTTLHRLLLGPALPPAQREQLTQWMEGNTTGANKIRAGVPANWRVADKTGSGAYGTTNDIAILYPPQGAPLILSIYVTRDGEKAAPAPQVISAATALVIRALTLA